LKISSNSEATQLRKNANRKDAKRGIGVLPHESLLNFQGDITLIKKGEAIETQNVIGRMRNNCMAYFLDEIRYEINGVEIDRIGFSGITSTIKNFVSLNQFESKILYNCGWSGGADC